MGANTYFRSLSNRRCWLQHHQELRELRKEFPQLDSRVFQQGKIPDPWDDYCRGDKDDRSWKRHRNTQYQIKSEPKEKRHRVKFKYDTPLTIIGSKWSWMRYTRRFGEAHFTAGKKWLVPYRVREAYRRHKASHSYE